MEARPEQAQQALVQTESLWNKAPAWRNLVVTASLLTTVALALPLIPQPQTTPSAPPAAAAAPAHHANAPVVQTAALPPAPKPVAAPPAPAEPAQLLPALKPVHHAAIPQPAPAQPAPAQLAPAQLASATPEAQPQTQSSVCTIVGPVTPQPRGSGRVMSFIDHATAMALIQMTQRRAGGQIDPDYVDNQRVAVQVGNGMTRTVLVPKTMQVHIGDTITWQEGYRNMNLPCNYVPSLITSDLGPQETGQPASQAQAPQQ